MPDIQHLGNCLCGAVRVAVKTDHREIAACHCGMCRRWGGGPLLALECGDEVEFIGAEHIGVFDSSEWAERGFCGRCGSHLFYRLKGGGHYSVPVGLFEGANWTLTEQIFIDEKPAFYDFANDTRNLTGAEVFAQFAAQDPSEK